MWKSAFLFSIIIALGCAMGAPLTDEVQAEVCEKTITGQGFNFYTNLVTGRNPPKCVQDNDNPRKGKLMVVTPHTAAFLIKIQKRALDLFIREPFDYIVYDDSKPHQDFTNWKTEGMQKTIQEHTESVGGVYKRLSQEFHEDRRCLFPDTLEPFVNNANTRCSDAYQYILRDKEVYCHPGVVLFLDADVILTSSFSPTAYMQEKDLDAISIPQIRPAMTADGTQEIELTYMWTALNIMDMRRLPGKHTMDWDCGSLSSYEGKEFNNTLHLDSGGHTYEWIDDYKPKMEWYSQEDIYELGAAAASVPEGSPSPARNDSSWTWFSQEWQEVYRTNKLYDLEFKSQLLGSLFLHLRNAGNWMGHGKRYKWIQPDQAKILHELLDRRKQEIP